MPCSMWPAMPTAMIDGIATSVMVAVFTITTCQDRSGVRRSCRSQPWVRSTETAAPSDSTPIIAP